MNATALCRALAAAILAAPAGWILAGILGAMAQGFHSAAFHRPLYLEGDHTTAALTAAAVAGAAALLAQLGKKKA